MATLGIPKLQKMDDNKTVNQTLHNSKCTHVTQNRNWTSTTKMRLPDYLHALLLSHTHPLYPWTCRLGGTRDRRDIHTYTSCKRAPSGQLPDLDGSTGEKRKHPTFKQVPPRAPLDSTQAVFKPSCAALIAHTYPPGPPPITKRSKFLFISNV